MKISEINIGRFVIYVAFLGLALNLWSCKSATADFPGHEFMPDMAHSTAYEANVNTYYKFNTWGGEADYKKYAMPRKPVNGTVARGDVSSFYADDYQGMLDLKEMMDGNSYTNSIGISSSGSVPYYYEDTEEERIRATNEIVDNPYPITGEGLARAKDLYVIYCGICHGEKGDGNGYLVSSENSDSKYPAQPADFLSEDFINSSNGRFYHAMMYGKNVMGGYTDKLSYEERWQVIHYIRSLQAKADGTVYNETENTLNSVGVPVASLNLKEKEVEVEIHEVKDHSEDHSGGH